MIGGRERQSLLVRKVWVGSVLRLALILAGLEVLVVMAIGVFGYLLLEVTGVVGGLRGLLGDLGLELEVSIGLVAALSVLGGLAAGIVTVVASVLGALLFNVAAGLARGVRFDVTWTARGGLHAPGLEIAPPRTAAPMPSPPVGSAGALVPTPHPAGGAGSPGGGSGWEEERAVFGTGSGVGGEETGRSGPGPS